MPLPPKTQFISLLYKEQIPAGLKNTFVIQNDDWNDYGSYVRFDLTWFDDRGRREFIGKTKILQGHIEGADWRVENRSHPPSRFQEDIGPNFISLGQSDAYYEWLFQQFGADAQKILAALRDIAVRPGLAGQFETSTVFRNGMMRENVARRSRQFGSAWSRGEEPVETPSFGYLCKLSDDEVPFRIDFDFRARDPLPGRVVGIIGPNLSYSRRCGWAPLGASLTPLLRAAA